MTSPLQSMDRYNFNDIYLEYGVETPNPSQFQKVVCMLLGFHFKSSGLSISSTLSKHHAKQNQSTDGGEPATFNSIHKCQTFETIAALFAFTRLSTSLTSCSLRMVQAVALLSLLQFSRVRRISEVFTLHLRISKYWLQNIFNSCSTVKTVQH